MKRGNGQNGKLPIFRQRLESIKGQMSVTDFAEKLGLSRQTIGFYLNGDRIPDIQTLRQICEECNISADYLLGLSDVKSSNSDIQTAVEITGLSECSISSIQAMKNSFSLWDERIALINYFFSHITATLNLTRTIIDYGEKLTSYQKEAKQYYQEYNKALFQSFRDFFQCADESDLNIPRNDTGKINAPHGSDPDGRRVQQMSDSCDAAMFKAQIAFNKILDMISKDICSQCEKAGNSDGQD